MKLCGFEIRHLLLPCVANGGDFAFSATSAETAGHQNSVCFREHLRPPHLNTVAASHNLDAFLNLLKRDGTMTLVGAPAEPHPSPEGGFPVF